MANGEHFDWLRATSHPAAPLAGAPHEVDEQALSILTEASDQQVPDAVDGRRTGSGGSPRRLARCVRRLVAAFVSPRSRYHHDERLLPPLEELLATLRAAQHEDGTFSVGNFHSPPDTGFLIGDFGVTSSLLSADGHPRSHPFTTAVQEMMRAAGPALATGGVHTPNHRWELCAALARINHVSPSTDYVERIDVWLSEGIDQDADGMYSERSPTYAAGVTNPSLLTVAWLLERPELVDVVRRNLEMTIYHTEPNGEVEAIHSRRQDQDHRIKNVCDFYLQYRELAITDQSPRFAAVARGIEQRSPGQLGDFMAEVLERPGLACLLPQSTELPKRYARVFGGAQLARLRRGSTAASVFGGTDWHAGGEPTDLFNRLGSGISTNPTLLRLRKGAAVLESLRMVASFFNMGHFRSDGLRLTPAGGFVLHSELSVPYYLPLPAEHRRKDGDYPHTVSVDGRFFSKMDFPHRRQQRRTLRTDISVAESSDGFDVGFAVDGECGVAITIELCFRKGGVLDGVEPWGEAGDFRLIGGYGSYTVGQDRIEFGPGNGTGDVDTSAGEQHLGRRLLVDGYRVYLTGMTPFHYNLDLRLH